MIVSKNIEEEVMITDLLREIIAGNQDELNIPFSSLQKQDSGIIRPGNYHTVMNSDKSVSICISSDAISFSTSNKVNNCDQFKSIFYDYKEHKIVFKWVINDEIGSSHFIKLYHNYETQELENQKITSEELEKGTNDIFDEIREFKEIKELVNIEEIIEEIKKYLKGVTRN